jgi:fumarate reductase flavoprotein subunit
MSCIATLVPQAKALGIDLRLNTQAISLLMKDPYTCTGIRAKTKGGKIIDFKAKAVVLATGCMSTNKALLAKYTSIDLEKVLIDGCQSGQDGDGHLMVEATAHGKATHLCVSALFINVKGFAYASPMGVCAGMQPTNLWVNQDAKRFTDESIVSDTAACNTAVEIQGSVFSIMDQAGFDKYAAGGCQSHYSGFADKLIGKPIPGLVADFEKYKNLPDVFYAQTLEELAKKMGIDAATFKATVEKYNGYAQSGTDADWGKKASNIWPIAKAPFYGFRLSSGMLNTNGGVRINTNAQVVDPRYKVISGLYATGILTSGWEGEAYIGGTCQPVALWGGRKAAKHIVANLL